MTTNSYSDPEKFNTSQDNNSWQSSSTIYVVNYEPVADAANEAAEYLKTLVQTDYTPEAVNSYYDAVTALYDFDLTLILTKMTVNPQLMLRILLFV